MTNQLNVMIVNMQGFLVDGLVSFLEVEGNFNVKTANNVAGAVKLLDAKGSCDLIIQNLSGSGGSKLDDFKTLLNHNEGQNIALMCGAECSSVEQEALQQEGVVGLIPSTLPKKNLITVLQFIAAGQKYTPLEFIISQRDKLFGLAKKLTEREFKVLSGIARGQTNKEIACDLGLTEPTIKRYTKTLFRKLHVNSRIQAALIAREHGIN